MLIPRLDSRRIFTVSTFMTGRSPAAVRMLLVSEDEKAISLLCDAMEQAHIHADVCLNPTQAAHRLRSSKYEGVVIDLAFGDAALDLLKKMAGFPSNHGAVCCALLHGGSQKASAFRAGANFVLPRPLEKSTVLRTLRAALPLMVRERRRYFRYPISTSATVTGHQTSFQATSINIAESGMAMLAAEPLRIGERLHIGLRFSGKTEFLSLEGEVRWINDSRTAGVQFVSPNEFLVEALDLWFDRGSKSCRTKPASRRRH